MTHTPGPWKVETPEDELLTFGDRHVLGGRPTTIIWANSDQGPGHDCSFYKQIALVGCDDIANAHLIAAAPQMLEALENALRSLETDGPKSAAASLLTHGKAALAAATPDKERE